MKLLGLPTLLALLLLAPVPVPAIAFPPGDPPVSTPARPAESLERGEGKPVAGRLTGDATRGFTFTADGAKDPRPLETGMIVHLEGNGPDPATGAPPFRADLGGGQQVSGRLGSFDEHQVVLVETAAAGAIRIARAGVQALVQRPGETLVLLEGFESLESSRWTVTGEPATTAALKLSGEQSLRLPAGGASLTYRLAEPFGAGRLEAAVHDDGTIIIGQKWFVDLTFRSPDGPQTVRAVLGWAEESLAVESSDGPALAIQRLARSPGWHRLSLRFGPDRCEVAVDGNELAHGKGFDGPLVEVRLASTSEGKDAPPKDLAAHVDDLRLVRFAESVGEPQVDVTQDEIRLISGDQVFGPVREGTAERLHASIEGRDVAFAWSEVAGVHFRRDAKPGMAIRGLLVRLAWRSSPGSDPRDVDVIEGALTDVTPSMLTLATPYAGSMSLPRRRVSMLTVVGRGERLVIDPSAHHLGDEISIMSPVLDPPEPEGGVLERSFELTRVSEGPAWLVVDVVQVVGESGNPDFSAKVKKGELRTNVALNGTPFDYINRHIATKNETPERIRIPIPKGLLHPGKNVVRFEQVGEADKPNSLDDLGLLGIALESESPATPAGPR